MIHGRKEMGCVDNPTYKGHNVQTWQGAFVYPKAVFTLFRNVTIEGRQHIMTYMQDILTSTLDTFIMSIYSFQTLIISSDILVWFRNSLSSHSVIPFYHVQERLWNCNLVILCSQFIIAK
jgi:hypothetical protein